MLLNYLTIQKENFMKKQFFYSIVILLLLFATLNAQNYTVSITSSGNVAGSPVSYNETAIRISFT